MPTFSKGQKVMVDKEAGLQPGYWQRHLYWGKIVDESNGLYMVRAEAVGFASVSRKAREDVGEGPGGRRGTRQRPVCAGRVGPRARGCHGRERGHDAGAGGEAGGGDLDQD